MIFPASSLRMIEPRAHSGYAESRLSRSFMMQLISLSRVIIDRPTSNHTSSSDDFRAPGQGDPRAVRLSVFRQRTNRGAIEFHRTPCLIILILRGTSDASRARRHRIHLGSTHPQTDSWETKTSPHAESAWSALIALRGGEVITKSRCSQITS